MKTKIYPLGALVGALVGALARGGFTYYNLFIAGHGDQGLKGAALFSLSLVALLPSAGIGLLVGAIAGLWGKPLMGAALGAVLSSFLMLLFVAPFFFCAFAADSADSQRWLAQFSLPYLIQKAIAGALAGGIGGLAGKYLHQMMEQHKGDSEIEVIGRE